MKNIISFILIIAFCVGACSWSVADKDLKNVNDFCKKNYPQMKMKIVSLDELPDNRTKSNCVYIEKIVSFSNGKSGTTTDGFYIAYNKRVPKGQKVISYAIWNPYTNYCDDVVQVFDNGTSR